MRVYRDGNVLCIEAPLLGQEHLLQIPGVIETPGGKALKVFPGERFRLGKKEIAAAVANHRAGEDVVVFGTSGYSVLDPKRCEALNIRPGEYEAACIGMIAACVKGLRAKVNNPSVRVVYGSSDMGVDQAIEQVCEAENCPLLGFTCPEYLWWVNNYTKGAVVCVTANKTEYCREYVSALDILFAANGGPVSYEMDVLAATRFHKRVVILDILRMLGGRIQGFDQNNKVLDAAAAFQERIANITSGEVFGEQNIGDPYVSTTNRLVERVVGYARQIVSPSRAYGILRT